MGAGLAHSLFAFVHSSTMTSLRPIAATSISSRSRRATGSLTFPRPMSGWCVARASCRDLSPSIIDKTSFVRGSSSQSSSSRGATWPSFFARRSVPSTSNTSNRIRAGTGTGRSTATLLSDLIPRDPIAATVPVTDRRPGGRSSGSSNEAVPSHVERKMRVLAALLVCTWVIATACSSPPVFEDLSACLAPADPATTAAGTLPALVDRAGTIALVRVSRVERTYTGYHDGLGARRLTLATVETAKGTAPSSFVVDDGPCPMFAASAGESFVALLEARPDGSGLKPVGLPTSKLGATPARSLTQLMADIRAIRPLDGDARALFERYGWTVTATQDVSEFELPPASGFALAGREIRGAAPYITEPLDTYATLSDEVGLDLRVSAAKPVELLSFWLERKPPEYREGTPFGHVLISDRRIVGAWVTTFAQGGPFSVRDRAAALAAPSARPPFPPRTRFPNGVNVAKSYDLATARAIAFKTGAGGNGTVP